MWTRQQCVAWGLVFAPGFVLCCFYATARADPADIARHQGLQHPWLSSAQYWVYPWHLASFVACKLTDLSSVFFFLQSSETTKRSITNRAYHLNFTFKIKCQIKFVYGALTRSWTQDTKMPPLPCKQRQRQRQLPTTWGGPRLVSRTQVAVVGLYKATTPLLLILS